MSVQAFFNRPVRPIDLKPLWQDMKQTRKHLVLASAWFTDSDTAGVFIDSPAEQKTVVFNAADMDRGTKQAYELIKAYFNNPVMWDEPDDPYTLLYSGVNSPKYGIADRSDNDPDAAQYRFVVLGSGNWQEGVMHHKFILCDRVVWLGSFNFTHQARKNYETLIRIDDPGVAKDFYNEVGELISEPNLFFGDTITNGAFKCQICGKVRPVQEAERLMSYDAYGGDDYNSAICKNCWRSKVEGIRAKYGNDAAAELIDAHSIWKPVCSTPRNTA